MYKINLTVPCDSDVVGHEDFFKAILGVVIFLLGVCGDKSGDGEQLQCKSYIASKKIATALLLQFFALFIHRRYNFLNLVKRFGKLRYILTARRSTVRTASAASAAYGANLL